MACSRFLVLRVEFEYSSKWLFPLFNVYGAVAAIAAGLPSTVM